MATHNTTTTQQQAAQAALQAELASAQAALDSGRADLPSAGSTANYNWGKLALGQWYTLQQIAKQVGYTPRRRARSGRPVWAPLRNAVHGQVVLVDTGSATVPTGRAGCLVQLNTGGYQTSNGNTAGGTQVFKRYK